MHIWRRVFVGSVLPTISFSSCTGGLIGIFLTFANGIAYANESPGELFTPVTTEWSCSLMSPWSGNATETQKNVHTKKQKSGCSKGSSCIENTSQDNHNRTTITWGDNSFIPIHAIHVTHDFPATQDKESANARDGPMYEQSRLFAHILLKRE